MSRSWWRTNRWWLPAVPVTLVLMLAAQSYRVEDFWWRTDSHRPVATGDQGELVAVRDPGEDAIGPFTREFSLRLVGVREVDDVQPGLSASVEEVPAGARAVEVTLDLEAAPDQLLRGCRLVLVDDDGVRYGGALTDPLGQGELCVPTNRPGPLPAFLEDQEEREVTGKPRPRTWSVSPVFLVPEDAEITAVRLSFDPPEYVELRVGADR